MVTETELFAVGIITVNGLLAAFTMWYYHRRLNLEEARSTTLIQQRDNLQVYYDSRLSIEKAKLDVEKQKLEVRKNGP